MSTVPVTRALQQTLVVSAIVGLHLGAVAIVKIGLLLHPKLTEIEWLRLTFIPDPPKPVVVERPDDLDARHCEGAVQREPDIEFPVFDDADSRPLADSGSEPTIVGGEPRLPSAPFQIPEIRTPDLRVKSLIDSCYPSASWRLLEEGAWSRAWSAARTAGLRPGRSTRSTGFHGSTRPRPAWFAGWSSSRAGAMAMRSRRPFDCRSCSSWTECKPAGRVCYAAAASAQSVGGGRLQSLRPTAKVTVAGNGCATSRADKNWQGAAARFGHATG